MPGKFPDNEGVGYHGIGEPHGPRLEDSPDECSVGREGAQELIHGGG